MHEADIESDTFRDIKVCARGVGKLAQPEVGVMTGPVGWKLLRVSDKDVILVCCHNMIVSCHIQNLLSGDEPIWVWVIK